MAKVLVVDDEEGIRRTLSLFLKKAGYEALTAEDANRALDVLRDHEVDIIVSDIILPGMTGVEFLAHLRSMASHAQVIMITGEPTVDTAAASLRAGAFDYVPKPIFKDEFLKIVSRAAKVKELHDQRRRLEAENERYRQHLERLVDERTAEVAVERDRAQMYFDLAGSILLVVGRDGTVLRINQAGSRILGRSESEIIGTKWFEEYVADTDREPLRDAFQKAMKREKSLSRHIESGIRQIDGSIRTVEWTNVVLTNEENEPVATLSSGSDVTEKRAAEEELRKSEERYALAVAGSHDGLWDWDLAKERIFFSERWKTALGYADGDIGDSPDEWFDLVHPDDLNHFRAGLDTYLFGGTSHFQSEYRIRHRDGTYRWVLCRGVAVRDDKNIPVRMAGSQSDITERKIFEEQLLHQALFDDLTQLSNRASFLDRLNQRIARGRWSDSWKYAVLFIDLDRFKNVNDSLGHLTGDELLREVASRMKSALSPTDSIARLGGDEFAVLLDEIEDDSRAVRAARRLLDVFRNPFQIGAHTMRVSASVGICFADKKYAGAGEMLRDADTAMFRAKETGGQGCVIFDQEMHTRAVRKLELERDLHIALEQNQFVACFQPIVSLADGEVAGFEALARWNHPERGMLSPAVFIDLAEETGQVTQIDFDIFRAALRQLRLWIEQFPQYPSLFVSVNLSARDFMQPDLVETICGIQESENVDAPRIRLEITESVFLDDSSCVATYVDRLRQKGFHISIDDFGTGYSSLSYLHQYPVDCLKIDRLFVRQLTSHERSTSIVRTIAMLAGSLRIPVVAEGIETAGDLDALRSLGIDYGQGYYFAKPMTKTEASAFLGENRRW